MKLTLLFRHSTAICTFVLGASLTLPQAWATDYTWTGTGSSAPWTSNTNWSPNTGFPSSSDNIVGNTSTAIVQISSTVSVGTITPTNYTASRGWSYVFQNGSSSLTANTITVNSSSNAVSSNSVELHIYDVASGTGGTLDIGTLNLIADTTAVEFNTTNDTSGAQWSRGIGRVSIDYTNLNASTANVTVRLGQTSLGNTIEDPGTDLGLVTFSGAFNRTMTLVFSTGASAGYTETVAATGLNDSIGTAGTTTINGGAAASAQTNNATLKLTGSGTYSTAAILANGSSSGTNQMSVLKTGTGVQELKGASTYTGGTIISAGTLLVSNTTGSGLGTGAVAVNGGTLGGNGIISGDTTIAANATLAPGSSAGLLTFSNALTFSDTDSKANFELASGTRGTDYDAVNVGGLLSYNGDLTLTITSALDNGTYNLFDFGSQTGNLDSITFAGGAYTGTFANNAGVWTAVSGSTTFTFTQATGDLQVVPEPGTWALLGLGLTALMTFGRKRHS